MESLSVIICTYNPNESVFQKCLECIEAAARQFLPTEVIIVDNNSTTPMRSSKIVAEFSNRQSNVRLVEEKTPGLTPARLRGIQEAHGELLVFIDDDNFIASDFFAKGMEVSKHNTHIGSWSGQVKLVFESQPPDWTRKYWGLLVHREFTGNRWSNFPHLPDTMPCGAGLFVRREVAAFYLELNRNGKRKIKLDREGSSLFSGGDNDLAACACDIGLGVGLFENLKLDHFIPGSRTEKAYLLRLAKGIAASDIVFKSFRNEYNESPGMKTKLANQLRILFKKKLDRQFYKAVLEGRELGRQLLEKNYD